MGFRDRLKGLIAPEKLAEAESLFDDIDLAFKKNATDIAELKGKIHERDGINPEEFRALEKERDDLRATLSAQEKNFKTAQTELETAKKAIELKTKSIERLVRDEGLVKALVEAKVKDPALLKGATAMLRDLVRVDEETAEAYIPIIDEKTKKETGRKPLSEYVTKDWAASEDAKPFVSAPASSGGGSGAPGNSGSGGKKTMTRAQFDALDPAAKVQASAEMLKTGGGITQQ